MCGIAGKVHTDPARPVEAPLLRRMTAALAHRGPDDEQVYLDGRVGLGIRRLAIIDVGGGRQPMTNEDASVWVVLNGEIYNFRELRDELLVAGHTFRTRSDTEVILHLYEALGFGLLARLRGMFAFALWDARRQRLLLARDRLGKKPLLYASLPNGLVFASELGALLHDPAVDRRIDLEALDAYLRCQAIPSPRTIYTGVRKLPPGHALVWEGGSTRLERYWSLTFTPKTRAAAPEVRQHIRDLLEESVRLRLESDVPLGVLLSGGIDSTAVAAVMARQLGQPVQTFSVGFEEEGYNELPLARRMATGIGAEHHEAVVKLDVAEILPVLARHFGEPFADKSAVPTYCVTRMAGQMLKVALSGDGGDEAFAGYLRYLPSRMQVPGGRLPAERRRWVEGLLRRALSVESGPLGGRLARQGLEFLAPPARSILFPEFFAGYRLRTLYREEVRRAVDAAWEEEVLGRWRGLPADMDDLDAALALDYGLYLPETLLAKMDIASMANSLEVRSPFLDHVLLEYAATIPGGLKVAGGTTKTLLRDTVRDLLPREILHGPKRGFSAPVGKWLRGPLRPYAEEMLLHPRGIPEFFRAAAVRALWDAHQSGRENHAMRLWALLVFEVWFRTWMDGNGPGGRGVA
jgi:asparagine synthase (glutamine-hydrolysing)